MAVAGVDVAQGSIGLVKDPDPQRHEHVRRRALGDVPVDVADGLGGVTVPGKRRSQVGEDRRHQDRRRRPLPGHVAEADADAAVIDREDVEEIAGDEPPGKRLHRVGKGANGALPLRAEERLRLSRPPEGSAP